MQLTFRFADVAATRWGISDAIDLLF